MTMDTHSHPHSHLDSNCCCSAELFFVVPCIVFAVLWYFYKDLGRLRPKGVDYTAQTVEAEDGARIRNYTSADRESLGFECPKTMYEWLERGLSVSNDGPCLGYRIDVNSPYTWITYGRTLERIKDFGAGLIQLGMKSGVVESRAFVGIFARTSAEWVIAEYGSYAYSLVVVPFYDSLGPDACQSALNRLGVSLLVCGDEKNLETMLAGKDGVKSLKTVIFISNVPEEARKKALENGISVLGFTDVEELGRLSPIPLKLPKPDDVGIMMFTSGTTGEPKAAMLTHRAICNSVENVILNLLPVRLNTSTTAIGYLPLAHIMERIQELSTFIHGGKVGFNSSGIPLLIDDIKVLRPDLIVLVPRILNRVYGKMYEAVQGSPVKRLVLETAILFKSWEMKFGIYRRNSVWDKLVFRKVQDQLGGNARICCTGSAPLDTKLTTAMRAALGCYIFEFYGQTETSGILTGTFAGDAVAGHVGAPSNGIEIKLVDVPELGYFAKNGQGEIWARGSHTMLGYYGEPSKTADSLDLDGFVHTGDVGQWIKGGRLKVIDRKKHIFKLSQGEYVAPEKLENVFLTSSQMFTQIFVDGNSLQPFTVALVYPNYDRWDQLKTTEGRKSLLPSMESNIKAALLDELRKVGKSRHFKSYEIPKKLYILPEPFSPENGLMTPTQKVKREAVRMMFKKQLQDLYRGVSLTD